MKSYKLDGHKGQWCRLEHVISLENEIAKLKRYRRRYHFARNIIRTLRGLDGEEVKNFVSNLKKPKDFTDMFNYTILDYKYNSEGKL